MILEITGLERGTMQSKANKTLTGLSLTGIKIDRDGNAGEQYDKFLMDWKNPDEIAVLEEAGIGATVNMRSVKDGNFWNLDSVEIMEEGTGQSSTPATKEPATQTPDGPATAQPKTGSMAAHGKVEETAANPMAVSLAPSEDAVRVASLKEAVRFTASILSSDERFKKLFPSTKTTVEIVSQFVVETASKFESFIKKGVKEVKSDDADLNKDGVDAQEPSLPGDED